jgi:hypothetical protein
MDPVDARFAKMTGEIHGLVEVCAVAAKRLGQAVSARHYEEIDVVIRERTIATKLAVVTGEALAVDRKQISRRRQQGPIPFVEQVNVFGGLGENFE